MQEENRNKIEDLKRRLYDPKDHSMVHQREGILHQINHKVSVDWEKDVQVKQDDAKKDNYKKPPLSIFKKFFIFSFVFCIGALGFAYYKFSQNDVSVSGDKINISIVGNSFTKGGDDLPLQIEITNSNNASLELANLIVEYPRGADDDITDVVRLPRDIIGTIKPGENIIRNITVKLYGEEKSIRNIKVSLEYHPEGSNAIFTRDKIYPITISLAPLSLKMEAPTNTSSDQLISLKVIATLNTSLPDENSMLQVVYPSNFIFDSAIPLPALGNSIWDLSQIKIGDPVIIEIKGRITGQDGDEQVFHAYAGTTNKTDRSVINVVYSSILQKILIVKPFLEARILVNGQEKTEYTVSGGGIVNVEIAWSNNLSTRITDGQIIASLSGNVFDENTLDSDKGFYDSINNQIIWEGSSVSELSEINPGEKGSVTFNFKTSSVLGLLNTVKNPQVSIKVSIKGRQPQFGTSYADINNFSEKIVKVLSDFQIVSSATYLSGSMTPKAETKTNYTISWTLSNSANGISQAKATSTIPIYVEWVGLISGETENVTYNEVTREVTWDIGSVLPNTGIDSNREASFVVSLKPSLSQVGSVPLLMKELSLSGIDLFSNTLLKSTKGNIVTSMISGLNSDGRVIQ
jgi:hypothetical protein